MNNYAKYILSALLVSAPTILHATEADSTLIRPSFALEYTGEMQSDFKDTKFVNQLHLDAEIPLSEHLRFNIGSITTATTSETSLADDLQVFSNIDTYGIPLALTVAGMTWQINDHHSIFGGIRRMDEDYFCSDGLSLFTNSSCGAFPTVSANHDIAVFPMAAVGMHYVYDNETLCVQGSLYNGVGYNKFSGRENVFRFCPQSDGIFGLAQAEYRHNGSNYFVGTSIHYGDVWYDESRKLRPTVWAYAEQSVARRLTVIAGYGHSFDNDALCKNFAGIGGRYSLPQVDLGIFSDYTRISGLNEFATEFTANIACTDYLSLQPTIHMITTDGKTKCIGTLRVNIAL